MNQGLWRIKGLPEKGLPIPGRFSRTLGGLLLFSFVLFSASNLSAKSPIPLYQSGSEALDGGDYYAALDSFKQALRINPFYVDALVGIAESYFLLQEYSEALSYAEQARKGASRRIDIMNLQGRIYLGLSELEEAENMFHQVMRIEPNNMDAAYGLAEIAVFRGNFKEGADLFERSLNISPDSRRALLSLVALSDEMGEEEKAEYYLSAALEHFPQDYIVLREAIRHYSRNRNWERAENLALQLLSLDPENRETTLELGLIYKNTGRYEEAVQYFKDSIKYQQEDPMVWYHLGQSFVGLERYDAALPCFKTVNIINPLDEVSRISKENLLMEHYPLSHQERSLAAAWHFDKGSEFEKKFQFDKALSEYRRGRLLAPLDLDGWWQYAGILDAMDQPNRYRSELEALHREQYDNLEFQRIYELVVSSEDLSLLADWGSPVVSRDSSVALSLYVDTSSSELLHQGGETDFIRYVADSLIRNPRFSIRRAAPITSSSEAFRASRSDNVDFYAVLTFSEMERSVRVHCELYLARTGTLMGYFDLLRSGNMRINEVLRKTARDIESRIPLKGYLMGVDDDTVLINLGALNQVEEGMSFVLLRQGAGYWLDSEPYREYNPEDRLGSVTIDQVQEELSVGTLQRNSPFDLVNPGDEVYTLPENSEEDVPAAGGMSDELKAQLLRLY